MVSGQWAVSDCMVIGDPLTVTVWSVRPTPGACHPRLPPPAAPYVTYPSISHAPGDPDPAVVDLFLPYYPPVPPRPVSPVS